MSTAMTDSPGAPGKRPGLVTVTGIIAIVFCSIGILSGLYSSIMLLAGGAEYYMSMYKGIYSSMPKMSDFYDDILMVAAKYLPFTTVLTVIQLLVSGAGLAGGILILRSRTQGVLLLRLYGIAALASLAVSTVWMIGYMSDLQGAMNNFFSSMDMPAGAAGISSGITQFAIYLGSILGVVFGASWPVLVLIFMGSRKVKNYFTKTGTPTA
jgi:hypothetical protein